MTARTTEATAATGSSRPGLTLEAYIAGIRGGDRAVLARAITLVESTRAEHNREAQALLQALLPYTGAAFRLGMTGVPGVGKSTTIDQLGMNLVRDGHRVAVLAVDPTSKRTGGSILGDRTRMARLSQEPRAFIRPSPTSGTLGGVTRKTRETMALCEAAGFDVVARHRVTRVQMAGHSLSKTGVNALMSRPFYFSSLRPPVADEIAATFT